MKRQDYYLGLTLIAFILCIGFNDINFSNLTGYFYLLSARGTFLLYLSLPLFVGFLFCLVREIYDIFRRINKK